MKTKIKAYINNKLELIRVWLLIRLLSNDEKWLLHHVIDDGIKNMERRKVCDKCADAFNIETDIKDLKILQSKYFDLK